MAKSIFARCAISAATSLARQRGFRGDSEEGPVEEAVIDRIWHFRRLPASLHSALTLPGATPIATEQDFREIALSLEGSVEQPHFDRRAFKARRIYATLAPDGLTANIRFPVEEQEFRCSTQPEAYRPIPSKWGAQGWTIATLSTLKPDELRVALESAWKHQAKVPRKRR